LTDQDRIKELEAALERAREAESSLAELRKRMDEELLAHEHRLDMVKAIANKYVASASAERTAKFWDDLERSEYAHVGLASPPSPAPVESKPKEGAYLCLECKFLHCEDSPLFNLHQVFADSAARRADGEGSK
jgi:hypothetical protein